MPLLVLSGCQSVTPRKGLLPVCDGGRLGQALGHVTTVYKVRQGLIFRYKHRACTARVALSRNIPLRAIDGVLKRDHVSAARVCTGIASSGVSVSAQSLRRGVTNHFSMTVWSVVSGRVRGSCKGRWWESGAPRRILPTILRRPRRDPRKQGVWVIVRNGRQHRINPSRCRHIYQSVTLRSKGRGNRQAGQRHPGNGPNGERASQGGRQALPPCSWGPQFHSYQTNRGHHKEGQTRAIRPPYLIPQTWRKIPRTYQHESRKEGL